MKAMGHAQVGRLPVVDTEELLVGIVNTQLDGIAGARQSRGAGDRPGKCLAVLRANRRREPMT